MKTGSAVAGSALFFLAAPGVVAGLAPWWIIRGYAHPLAESLVQRGLGLLFIAAGLAFLLHAFSRFILEGKGTPAPVAPTERLVIGGVYRYVRNPMYLAVIGVIVGQALFFGSWSLAGYAAAAAAVMAAFVHFHEEPVLAARYGDQYDRYRRAVPGWLPRLTPWRP